MTGAASTSVSTAAAASSHNCWNRRGHRRRCHYCRFRRLPRCDRRHGRRSDRLSLAVESWVFGLEAQGNWADFGGSTEPRVSRRHQPYAHRRLRPFHRPGWLCLEQRPVLREGRRRRYRQQVRGLRQDRRPSSIPPPAHVGAARWVPASNSASLRTGRSASNTTTCSWATQPYRFPRSSIAGLDTRNDDQPGRGHGHRSPELSLGRSGDREILICLR